MLKENYDGNNRVSLTDPEAHKMHMKDDTIKFAYLLQTVVDVKTGLILMQKIVEDKTDRYQLISAIDYILVNQQIILKQKVLRILKITINNLILLTN